MIFLGFFYLLKLLSSIAEINIDSKGNELTYWASSPFTDEETKRLNNLTDWVNKKQRQNSISALDLCLQEWLLNRQMLCGILLFLLLVVFSSLFFPTTALLFHQRIILKLVQQLLHKFHSLVFIFNISHIISLSAIP